MSVELSTRQVGPVRVIVVAGRIDHANALEFEERLAPHVGDCGDQPGMVRGVVFDLQGLAYVSSAGLRVLWAAARRSRERGGQIAVAALTPLVAEVFTVTRFDVYFQRFDAVDEAVTALTPG